jgi:hypothetical protein
MISTWTVVVMRDRLRVVSVELLPQSGEATGQPSGATRSGSRAAAP